MEGKRRGKECPSLKQDLFLLKAGSEITLHIIDVVAQGVETRQQKHGGSCLWISVHERTAVSGRNSFALGRNYSGWELVRAGLFQHKVASCSFFSLALGHLGISWLVLFMLLSLGA